LNKYITSNEQLSHSAIEQGKKLKLLELDLKLVKDDNKVLQSQIDEAIQIIAQYDSKYNDLLKQDATSRIPRGYYNNSASANNSYEDLKDFLNYNFYLPKGYKLGVFDCSESAAYLEWVLQNNGFDAKIVIGPTPWAESGYHAWVFVYTEQDVVAIEPTVLTGGVERLFDSISNIINNSARGVVYYNQNDTAKNYYEVYTEVFGDISEAVKYSKSTEEWNWWEGSWGFE
jgi:hypothetical protein